MTSAPGQISVAFPQGNGTDICLLTNDAVLFYFHRFLLSYTSPVFREMIEPGNFSLSQPLRVDEESGTLDLLLRHLDPTKVTPNLDPDTIFELLEASKKYQIATIPQWFNNQMTLQDSSNSGQVDLIIRKRPMYLLKISEELELPQVSRIALRQLVKANASVLFDENAESIINPRMWRHLMQLRMERSKFVSEVLIKFLLKTLEAGEASKNRHRRDCAVNDIIRSLIVYVGIMATQEPSWEKFEQVACSYGGCWGDCGSPIEVLRTTKPVLLWKEDGDGDGGTSNLYTDILPDGISPVHIPASTTVLEETARGANPALVPVYEDIKRTIQAKEAELPALPVHSSPPPGPHVRPTNPFAAF